MAFFKFLFYALLFLLIKLGDTVYSVLTFPFSLIGFSLSKIFSFLRLFTKINRKSFSRNKKRSYKKSHTISHNNKNNFVFFSKLFKSLVSFLALIVTVIMYFPRLFVGLLGKIKFKKKKKKSRKKEVLVKNSPTFFFKIKYLVIGTVFAFFFFFLPATFLIFIGDLPKLSNLSVNYISKTTKILDRNGVLLFEIYANQNRTIVSLDKIPKDLIEATIATEDRDFYRHSGFDLRGIARALYIDLRHEKLQGGSTITQQLVKSALLTPEATISRKVREIVLAFWAEQKYTKNQILELYFNYIPYGGTAWGVEAASQIYFGKDVSKLSLSESSYLAGLPQAPSIYSPFSGDGSSGKRRQKEVLKSMVDERYITQREADSAYKEKLIFRSPQVPIEAPHFVMYVKDLLVRKYGLLGVERGGLQVTTSLDLETQKVAEEIVSDEVDRDGYLGVGNGSSLVTNPSNGDILAMVGSRDYFDPDHDGNVNITTALRQPGSTIKLVTYALALTKGLTETTILDDTPLTIKYPGYPSYTPVNYDGRFHGRIPLRLAFANSFNIPAVRLAQRFGVEEVVNFGKQMGISSWGSPDNYGVSITLGAAEASMIDLATAYGTVANEGKKVELDPILKITDSEGKVLQKKEDKYSQVLDPGVAFILSDILADDRARSISFGSNSMLVIPNRRVSVKTGTTDNKRDNWTIGYTPTRLVATWVGNNDNTPLSQALASGVTGAAPMWNRIMTKILENNDTNSQIPENITSKQCFGYTAYFVLGTETKDSCRFSLPTPTLQQQ